MIIIHVKKELLGGHERQRCAYEGGMREATQRLRALVLLRVWEFGSLHPHE